MPFECKKEHKKPKNKIEICRTDKGRTSIHPLRCSALNTALGSPFGRAGGEAD